VRGQHNRRCLNRPLLGAPFCFHHSYEASEPKGAPEPGYEWYPLRDGLGRPYLWFQLRTDKAKRQARYLNRHGATPKRVGTSRDPPRARRGAIAPQVDEAPPRGCRTAGGRATT
jgi:hypothetical protein